jgi:hypothetical protein
MVFDCDVKTFRTADCSTDYCLVATEVRERVVMCKQTIHRFPMERCSVKKLNEVEGKEHPVEVSISLQLCKVWTLR